ncbi:hypothetical protein LYSHEL_10510 [Lysobacter helvus]|uniref:DUF4124 domain-containing protein n=2 Tax=Lysobacteraceae TaxID=32033 RepID=A0ABM7Q465_9GAMM|nr:MULTISPECIES: DUF4124 domain-containing protein [Lysobacter]BCT92027.1 hypothetical protein LYSCAS_10510 [Lysobacter caseinilyticus]BCT95180.1 hypothetical protein LYSHEL_10510 [Lysobacter helvus]
MQSTPRLVAALVLAGLASAVPVRAFAADVTIYRCIDAKGHVTLRDSPCAAGEKQETRTMARPVDAAPRAPQARPAPVEAPAPRERTTVIYQPRPLYECITPDNVRYTSETDEGNPRWVPLWTLGYPVYAIPGHHSGAGFALSNGNMSISGGSHSVSGPYISPAAYGAGTYVQDTCYALPQADVCDRIRDRREEIRTRFFNAMPSERDVLRVEERSLNARIEQDCSAH